MTEFTCCKCNLTFPKINNDEWNSFKSAEEFLNLYPEAKNHLTIILCDDCNKEFVAWFSKLTKEDKELMEKEFIGEYR